MAAKLTFDGVNRIIQITLAPSGGVVEIDVKIDLYSDGKEDWLSDPTLNKLKFPISVVGGNPLPGSKKLGGTFFLDPTWKIRPYEASHTFRVNGNLYSPDGISPFVSTIGAYNIFLEHQVSSLVDSTVQQLSEIEFNTFANMVHVNVIDGISGTTYPAGNAEYPVNNIPDAIAIASSRGFSTLHIMSNITLDTGDDISNYILVGENANKTTIIVNPGAETLGAEFRECTLTGTLDGNSIVRNSVISNLNYVSGIIYNSMLSSGTIVLGGNDIAYFLNCYSGVAGIGTPVIDCAGDGPKVVFRNYAGGVKFINKSGTDEVSVDLSSGVVILDSTITAGEIVIRGVGGHVEDNSTGSTVVYNELLSVNNVTKTVWEAQTADYNISGSFGNFIQNKLLTVSKYLGLK